MSMFISPDLARAISQDRRAQLERMARESRLRRDYKRSHRHR
jgi:hypothetical protein